MSFIKRGSLFLILAVTIIVLLPAALFAQDVIAYIGEVSGDVIVIKANPGKEIAATLGMFLEAGDTVKTGADSYSSIIFQDDGSRVKLGENAQLTLNAERRKKNLNKRMFLGAGKLWAKVNKRRGTDFQVKTPTSVASVKGTRFVVDERMGETWLWVLEDAVVFGSDAGTITVEEGKYARATPEEIETGDIEDGTVPVEPGPHELLIFLEQQSESTQLQKELRIEYLE